MNAIRIFNPSILQSLFSSKICWNLSPCLGFPFQDGVFVGMGFEPLLGSCDDLVEVFRLGVADELGLASLLFHPKHGIAGVGVDGRVLALTVEHGQGMNDGQELANIVCAQWVFLVKNLGAGLRVHALVLHHAGVAATSSIHADAVPNDASAGGFGGFCWAARARSGRGFELDVLRKIAVVGCLGFFPAAETFVLRLRVALDLLLALVPTIVNTWHHALPNHVVFLLVGHKFVTGSMVVLGRLVAER